MDDERLEVVVARIDENVKNMRNSLDPLMITVQSHRDQLSVLQNDKKWMARISHFCIGLVGVIIGACAEFLRK